MARALDDWDKVPVIRWSPDRPIAAAESQAIQLDLFLHSGPVMIANEALEALVGRDAPRAARALARLRAEAHDYPSLRALEVLTQALIEWRRSTGAAEISSAVSWLDQVVAPAAWDAAGSQAQRFLDAFFRDLADSARGLAYDPAQPKAHRAWLSLRCGDWAEAEAAALTIADGTAIADVLHWLCIARYRQRGLAAARPALFRLAWQDPQRLASIVEEMGDVLLTRALQSFERACDWESVEASELPAWFPAWYVIEHPAVSNDFDCVGPPTSPARAARLLARILDLERQADWKSLIALREQLRGLNSDLFSVYMTRRAIRYAR